MPEPHRIQAVRAFRPHGRRYVATAVQSQHNVVINSQQAPAQPRRIVFLVPVPDLNKPSA